jgi:hypothetical protein
VTTIRIELGADALAALRKPIVGEGGFQSLLRTLQAQVADANVLVLTPDLTERIARYVHDYGQGGFQGRLESVLEELRKLARALLPLAA